MGKSYNINQWGPGCQWCKMRLLFLVKVTISISGGRGCQWCKMRLLFLVNVTILIIGGGGGGGLSMV